jgi:hypothetical protein
VLFRQIRSGKIWANAFLNGSPASVASAEEREGEAHCCGAAYRKPKSGFSSYV